MEHPGIRDLIKANPRIWWAFSLALLVRLVLLATLHDSYYTAGMAQGELARNLVEGRGFILNDPFAAHVGRMQDSVHRLVDIEDALRSTVPDDRPENLDPFIAYMMPGQGILLAGTYATFGEYRYIYLQTLQAVLDAAGVLLIFWLGTVLFGKKTGYMSAILLAVYIPEARLAISATRDAWMPLVYLGSACVVVSAWKKPSAVTYVILGTVVGVGAYFRSEILLLPFFYLFIKFILDRKVREIVKPVFLVLVPIVVLLLPWTVRNVIVFDRVIPTNSGLWLAMWQSFGEYENDFGAVNNDLVTFQQTREWGFTAEFDSPEYDDIFRDRVLGVIAGRPGWVAWTVVRRLARIPFQMHAWGIPQTEDMIGSNTEYTVGSVDVRSYWDYVSADVSRFIVHATARLINASLFAGLGVWLLTIGKMTRREGMILLVVPLYNILIHAFLGVHARYILPTNSLLLPFVAALLAHRLEPSASKMKPASP